MLAVLSLDAIEPLLALVTLFALAGGALLIGRQLASGSRAAGQAGEEAPPSWASEREYGPAGTSPSVVHSTGPEHGVSKGSEGREEPRYYREFLAAIAAHDADRFGFFSQLDDAESRRRYVDENGDTVIHHIARSGFEFGFTASLINSNEWTGVELNRAGQTPAEVAMSAGHSSLAVMLRLVEGLDYDRRLEISIMPMTGRAPEWFNDAIAEVART